MRRIILVTGGARSGKSRKAEELAIKLCKDPKRRVYIATAQAFDDEMKDRISKHQERRGDAFQTVEAPVELGKAITEAQNKSDVILVDCLTVWMGNLLYYKKPEEKEILLKALKEADNTVILVTNETGMGIVPDNELSRRFRDEAGFLNQAVAEIADNVIFMVSGIEMQIKGRL